MAEQGTVIPGEGEVVSLSPQIHQEAVAEKARSKGWKPLEEFQGDAADWIPASEFLGREKLYNTIHDLRRQNTRLEKDISTISKHFVNMEESAYNRALKELQAKQADAVETQDHAAVKEVTKEIVTLETSHATQKAQTAQTQAGESPDFVEWRGQNTWFTEDAEMREDAISYGIGHAAKNPNLSQKEVLDYVSAKIKKSYPEKFQTKKQPQRREPVVESGNGSGAEAAPAKKGGKGLTVADLDEREVATMKTFVKRGVFKEAAKKRGISEQAVYLEDLAKAKGV